MLGVVCGLAVETTSDVRIAHATTPLVIEGRIAVRPWVDDMGQISDLEYGLERDWVADISNGEERQGEPWIERMFVSSAQLVANAGTWMQSRVMLLPAQPWVGNDIAGRILIRSEVDNVGRLTRIEFGFRPSWGLEAPETDTGPDDVFPVKRFLTRQLAERSGGRWLLSSRLSIIVPLRLCALPFGVVGTERCVPTIVSAGANHTCAGYLTGDVTCWGDNKFGQAEVPHGSFAAVSAGGEHTCGLRSSGHIQCWGSNAAGQTAAPWGTFRQVSAGGRHTCGLRETGVVECWGANEHGQADALAGRFVAVSAGTGHSCGLRDDREVECWGSNAVGQTDVPDGRFQAVSAGWLHSCGLLETGEVRCWGPNARGEGSPPAGRFRSISAGAVFTCGVRDGGQVECWGWNEHGEMEVPRWAQFQSVSAGSQHACGLIESPRSSVAYRNTDVVCWGANDVGQASAPIPEERDW